MRTFGIIFDDIFRSKRDGFVFSTWRAHRLLLLAWNKGGSGAQSKLLKTLYQASFERGENVADINLLSTYAEDSGVISKDEVSLVSRLADKPVECVLKPSLVRLPSSSNQMSSLPTCNAWFHVRSVMVLVVFLSQSSTAAGQSAADSRQTCSTRCVDRTLHVHTLLLSIGW